MRIRLLLLLLSFNVFCFSEDSPLSIHIDESSPHGVFFVKVENVSEKSVFIESLSLKLDSKSYVVAEHFEIASGKRKRLRCSVDIPDNNSIYLLQVFLSLNQRPHFNVLNLFVAKQGDDLNLWGGSDKLTSQEGLFDLRTQFWRKKHFLLLLLCFLPFLSIGIILKRYSKKKQVIIPLILFAIGLALQLPSLFYHDLSVWDEPYHISSAYKYIHNMMFMESHPPLGKMIIATGEVIFNPNVNINTTAFLNTDYIQNFPNNFRFYGLRFFPALFSAALPALLYILVNNLFNRRALSYLFSSFILFDNALSVHTGKAMLEGSQLFFVLCSLIISVYLLRTSRSNVKDYFYLGIFIALAVMIKINSLSLLFLPCFIVLQEVFERRGTIGDYRKVVKYIATRAITFTGAGLIVFVIIWNIHFSLGSAVNPALTYGASDLSIRNIKSQGSCVSQFPSRMKDNLLFMSNYQKKVPALDLNKIGENGSHPIFWPLGVKSIRYRWEKVGGKVKYLILQCNPLVWLFSFLGAVFGVVFIFLDTFYSIPKEAGIYRKYIWLFTLLYLGYMIAVLQVERVIYLYHYFIPLIFSIILASIFFKQFFFYELIKKKVIMKPAITLLGVSIILFFVFYLPFTYFQPLAYNEFQLRNLFMPWRLEAVSY